MPELPPGSLAQLRIARQSSLPLGLRDDRLPLSDSPPVIVTPHAVEGGGILEIEINRPDVHNAVNGEAARLLWDAWLRFRDDDSLTVAILHGAGETAFCSGADLTGLEELARVAAEAEASGPMGGSRIVQAKPVITVSQGYTYAGGLELFCHGHIRLAEPQATFSVACRRWGVPLVDGGTVYLPRLLGWGAALPLIITGQRITAERGVQIGLIWELVPQPRGDWRGPCRWRGKSASSRATRSWPISARRSSGAHQPLDAALRARGPQSRSRHAKREHAPWRRVVSAGKRFWFT